MTLTPHELAAVLLGLGREGIALAPEGDGIRYSPTPLSAALSTADWFAREAERVYGLHGETPTQSQNRRLLDVIQRKGGDVSARELVQACRHLFAKTEDAESALAEQVGAGVGEWYQPPQASAGRPPARRFRLRGRTQHNENPPHDPASGNNVVLCSTGAQSNTLPDDDEGGVI